MKTLMGLFMFVSSVACASQNLTVIGHRGACGYRPEHTLESYRLAIAMGADFIEPDLVATKDGVLIARHENEIGGTTDVATKFPDRKATKVIDGESKTGWFTEDFTLAEIKSLRANERLATRNHAYDGQFLIPTFAEILDLAAANHVGVYPETKHPTYFHSVGLDLEPRLIEMLKARGLVRRDSPVIVQSFEVSSLRKLAAAIDVRLIFLIDEVEKRPFDHVVANDPRTYEDMLKPAELKTLAKVLYGIGPWKDQIVPVGKEGQIGEPTSLINDAHAAGLKVHAYTFRADAPFLNAAYAGDLRNEIRKFRALGLDGVFSDFPDIAVSVRDEGFPRPK